MSVSLSLSLCVPPKLGPRNQAEAWSSDTSQVLPARQSAAAPPSGGRGAAPGPRPSIRSRWPPGAQTAQDPLVRESTLNDIGIPDMI